MSLEFWDTSGVEAVGMKVRVEARGEGEGRVGGGDGERKSGERVCSWD